MKFRTIITNIVLLLFAGLLAGCGTLGYYGQAITGQLAILVNRKPIKGILAETDASPELKEKLNLVLAITKFAEEELHLPSGDNYRSYVALNRPYVVWVLHAAPEFSLVPRSWCWPVVGCMTYRGYFSRAAALSHGRRLGKRGYDVHVGGVSAYSTLGWFDDPVLSTFINRSEAELASLIFHELAHQVLYVGGNTMFNEGFAVAVEEEGVRRWMEARGNGEDYPEFKEDHIRRKQFVELVMESRGELERLYCRTLPPEKMRAEKKRIMERLGSRYAGLKARWKGYAGYDNWFRTPVNNARINTVSTYYELVPMFQRVLGECRGDLALFYRRCREISVKPNGLHGGGR